MMMSKLFPFAKEAFAALGVDVDAAIAAADAVPLSLHCWQGDDVLGFESARKVGLSGGIAVTGNYPYRARTPDELRADLDKTLSLIPGALRANFHASYLEDGGEPVDRDAIEPKHFAGWTDWAVGKGIGLDFNTTFFAHPKSEGGSLTNPDPGIRAFWIEHGKRCRKIAAYMAERTGKPCVINHWIHDGGKERPVCSMAPRERLVACLDEILATPYSPAVLDALESKLFGIGAEAYTPGSHEFYMAYVLSRPGDLLLTLDTGHFHPTEMVSQKITAMLCFVKNLLLHVSRPERWDSDHVVRFDDELRNLMGELVANQVLDRVKIALDYFDASVNRVAAWATGARNTRKALLYALLTPYAKLKALEEAGDATGVLVLSEEYKDLPYGAVWAHYCETKGIPGAEWIEDVRKYEREVLRKR
jgi:L-rhamnose isomerase